MNIYFHAIFYIKLYVRVMCARYLCLFVGPSGLQAAGSVHQIFTQLFCPDTNVLVSLVVMLWYCSYIVHMSDPTSKSENNSLM